MTLPRIVILAGPTATGKTSIAIQAAQAAANVELVNADSRQVRSGMLVATCAATAHELGGVTMHLQGHVHPTADHTVAHWVASARQVLPEIAARGHVALVVGGTGLYIEALVRGWALSSAPPDPTVRALRRRRAETNEGLLLLAEELTHRDPKGSSSIDLSNPRRVVRALEILDSGVESLASSRGSADAPEARILVLDLEKEDHYRAIDERASKMVHSGALQQEIKDLMEHGLTEVHIARGGIGYREGLALHHGKISHSDAVSEIARRTRKYAKAQRTWFRHHDGEWHIRQHRAHAPSTNAVLHSLDEAMSWAQAA